LLNIAFLPIFFRTDGLQTPAGDSPAVAKAYARMATRYEAMGQRVAEAWSHGERSAAVPPQ